MKIPEITINPFRAFRCPELKNALDAQAARTYRAKMEKIDCQLADLERLAEKYQKAAGAQPITIHANATPRAVNQKISQV